MRVYREREKEGFRVSGGKYKDGDWSEIWFTILGFFPK